MTDLTRVPTVKQTRNVIENMPLEEPNDFKFQKALKYIYLIAGRLAEVYGDHSPKGNDTFIREIYGEEAVIFLVKTARRGGLYRVIAVPHNTEPWASELFTFFRSYHNSNPFDIGHIIDTSRKYLQNKTSELFDKHGHEMRRDPYIRTEIIAAEDRVVKEGSINGEKRYLIEYPNEERLWHEEKIIKKTRIVKEKPKSFRIKHLREQRENELRQKYNFTDEQARIYLGLKQNTRVTNLIRYDGVEPIDSKILEEVEAIAKSYFKQFL